jgi:hypothetical protein
LVVDVWSRKVVAWDVAEAESADIAAELVQRACLNERYSRPRGFGANQPPQQPLTLHADNGSAMRAATLALESRLEELVVMRSFSRPRVSNDSHFSEALFCTVKYRPDYPNRPFASNEEACEWVRTFVDWYNHQHRHSGIKFVTTHQRHSGTATVITSSPGLMRLPSGSLWEVNAEISTRLAEEPEFTSRLWRTPRNSASSRSMAAPSDPRVSQKSRVLETVASTSSSVNPAWGGGAFLPGGAIGVGGGAETSVESSGVFYLRRKIS